MSSLAKCSLYAGLRKHPFPAGCGLASKIHQQLAISITEVQFQQPIYHSSTRIYSLFNVRTHTQNLWYGKKVNVVRTATNVVMFPSPWGLGPPGSYAEAQRAGIFPVAGLGIRRNSSNRCGVGTQRPTWTPPDQGTVDGTDVFALFCHPSRSQVPNL